ADRGGEGRERFLRESLSRLGPARDQPLDLDLADRRSTWNGLGAGKERGEPAAESLLAGHAPPRLLRNSRASARYASAPLDLTSYASAGFPKDGASARRTLLGITVSNTFFPRCLRMSSVTCRDRLVRSSYIVKTIPSKRTAGLNALRIRSI